MAQNRQIQNTITTRVNRRVFDKATTTNAEPTVVASVPLGQGIASYFEVRAFALTSNLSALQAMNVQAGFRRPIGGNVIRATSNNGAGLPYSASSGDFLGKSPFLDLVANTSTQTIDIVVTGLANTTINWFFESLSVQNLV